jgi:hypothetical protein
VTPTATTTRETDSGVLEVAVVGAQAWRIGFAPEPFKWTPWEYAEIGGFDGRWDDPDGVYRTLYLGDRLLGVLLEVLARFRPDIALAAELAAIDDEDAEAERYPTLPAGHVPRSWMQPRLVGAAQVRGEFVDVRRASTVGTLRRRFAALAADLQLPDLDAAALKATAPRQLTQVISSWFYRALRPPVSGVEFGSRHGDDLTMWAVFEQPGEAESGSNCLRDATAAALAEDMPDVIEAMRIHGLVWAD